MVLLSPYYRNKAHNDQGSKDVDIDDPDSVKGADPDAVAAAAKAKGYIESPANDPEGKKYAAPNGSDVVRIMPGKPNRSDPMKRGPYAVISKHGEKTFIPLKGNPTL